MTSDGFQHMTQLDTSRRMIGADYLLDYSTCAQQTQHYPLSFNYVHTICSSDPATIDGFNAYCGAMVQQPFYVLPTYTDPSSSAPFDSLQSGPVESNDSPIVKTEDTYPEDTGYGIDEISPQELESPGDSTQLSFGTDVDTLMRAIQTKSRGDTLEFQSPASGELGNQPYADSPEHCARARKNGLEHIGFRARKKYECHMPSCAKIFSQKTHLEIHVRSHTGHKPFVSVPDNTRGVRTERSRFQLCREASCGQRFSQLGNLKVRSCPSSLTAS